jgi:transposase
MDARQERGLLIAATGRLSQKGKVWLVPSQSGQHRYTVCPDAEQPHCTCQDHETRGVKCKHIFAVEFVIQREFNFDGTVTETKTVTIQETVRKTYPQDWANYNAAQVNEKDQFCRLLHDLCGCIPEPEQARTGRPRLSLPDAVFSACFKIYSGVSGRRFMSDLRAAQDKGYIEKTPHFNSIFNYLENPALEPILKSLIVRTSLPLKAIETDFAVDSSGFTTSRFNKWYDRKYGKLHERQHWVKVQVMCGVKTNVITAVEVLDGDGSDAKFLPPLVAQTAKNFAINEVLADKGYASVENLEVVAAVGGTCYIPFKASATGKAGGLWGRMFHYFQYRREEFLSHYHKRSNIESTFSMIKAKFRDHLRSKSDSAMRNEILCKMLCHNICRLIHAIYELGLQPTFCADLSPAQQPGLTG